MTTLPPRRVDVLRAAQSCGAQSKRESDRLSLVKPGAGNESRTRDLNLGKVALYQLSYSRAKTERYYNFNSAAADAVHVAEDGANTSPPARSTGQAVASCGMSAALILDIAFSRFAIDVANEMRT